MTKRTERRRRAVSGRRNNGCHRVFFQLSLATIQDLTREVQWMRVHQAQAPTPPLLRHPYPGSWDPPCPCLPATPSPRALFICLRTLDLCLRWVPGTSATTAIISACWAVDHRSRWAVSWACQPAQTAVCFWATATAVIHHHPLLLLLQQTICLTPTRPGLQNQSR